MPTPPVLSVQRSQKIVIGKRYLDELGKYERLRPGDEFSVKVDPVNKTITLSKIT